LLRIKPPFLDHPLHNHVILPGSCPHSMCYLDQDCGYPAHFENTQVACPPT
jgi:hypothetical protein